VFGVAAPAAGQGTVIAGYSSGELVAYRYENGRQLWSDALARTSIATSVSTLTDIDADPIIERGRVYALGQGGRMAAYELVSGQRIWELNLAGHLHPGGGGRVDLHADRRGQAAVHRQGQRQGPLDEPASPLCQPQEEGKADLLDRPGAGGQQALGGQFARQIVTVTVGDGTMAVAGRVNAPVTLAPIVADKTLYVLDDSGAITAWR
jgi:hypothetical protein